MGYKEIKSNYIRQKIRETKWEDRSYISDLMSLESLILTGPGGMAGARLWVKLESQYPEEFKAIYFELKPEKAKEIFERKRKELEKLRKEERERIKRNKKRLEERLKEWLEMGGQP